MRRAPIVLSLIPVFNLITVSLAFATYGSLAGLSNKQLSHIIPRLQYHPPEAPPGPLNDTSAKLVNNAAHPWRPAGPGDQRGPCPGLNTLASHGYLPRDGIATPAQIINAVQEGFNMENTLAKFVTYAAFLVDGNLITNKLSVGGKTSLTGPFPPAPAIVGGLDTHAVFEGDASMTRGDFFFGNNHDFNETLFQEFVDYSDRFGAGKYNITVAGELRWRRIQDSIANNPTFSFVSPRYFTAYAESTFPVEFFVDGRKIGAEAGQLDMVTARSFFQQSRFPDDFFRANEPKSGSEIRTVASAHPIQPGGNANGRVNNYALDPTSADFSNSCLLYVNFANQTVRSLYPNPSGRLLDSLKTNLRFFYSGLSANTKVGCPEIFPYGI